MFCRGMLIDTLSLFNLISQQYLIQGMNQCKSRRSCIIWWLLQQTVRESAIFTHNILSPETNTITVTNRAPPQSLVPQGNISLPEAVANHAWVPLSHRGILRIHKTACAHSEVPRCSHTSQRYFSTFMAVAYVHAKSEYGKNPANEA